VCSAVDRESLSCLHWAPDVVLENCMAFSFPRSSPYNRSRWLFDVAARFWLAFFSPGVGLGASWVGTVFACSWAGAPVAFRTGRWDGWMSGADLMLMVLSLLRNPAQPNGQRKTMVLMSHSLAPISLIAASFLSSRVFCIYTSHVSFFNPLPHIVRSSLPLPIPQILHLINSHQTPLHATAQVALAQLPTLGRIDAASGFQAAQVLFH
jgi:hypothetical protein